MEGPRGGVQMIIEEVIEVSNASSAPCSPRRWTHHFVVINSSSR
jgi:hypothetical protein